jgi:electron transfer flavoprotein beta subunit
MHVVVLMKPVHNPDVPLKEEEIRDPAFGRREAHAAFGPYDENALETALTLKDAQAQTRVTVVSGFDDDQEPLLRTALAAGADEVVWVPFDPWPLDAGTVGGVLADVVAALEPSVNAVLAGIQSGDWDTGLVPRAVAAALGWPFIEGVVGVRGDEATGRFRVETGGPAGARTLSVEGPFVGAVIAAGTNALRYPTMRDRLAAKRKPLRRVAAPAVPAGTPVAVAPAPEARRETVFLEGADDAEKGRALAEALRERGWIEGRGKGGSGR